MIYISIVLFLVFALFIAVGLYANNNKLPELISEFYYLGATWRFSIVIIAVALGMMVSILDSGKGIQALAFLGCGGLMFVGASPNYLDKDNYIIHKVGATVAAIGCIGWCMSVNIVPSIVLGIAYILYSLYGGKKLWFIAELLAFLDTFVTYWTV